ncbi:MAG: hypothetical protein PHQ43_09735 [Dehalococcoidales bacterium]|nr:hypothetical protein [Dehalococcoidales bacterium]
MQAILFTGNGEDCNLCAEAEKKFKELYAEELKNDEATIANMDKDEGAYEFWATHGLPLAPVVVIATDSGKIIDQWETGEIPEPVEDEVSEKKPPIDKPK